MRRFATVYAALIAVSLLVWPAAITLRAAVAVVQDRDACASGCDVTDDFSDNNIVVSGLTGFTPGNCASVVAQHGHPSRTFNTPTDSGSNSYTEAIENLDGNVSAVAISFARVTTTATSVTVQLSGSSAFGQDRVTVLEVSGCADPLALDPVNSVDSPSGTTHTIPSITTTTANALVVAAFTCSTGSFTPDAGYTTLTNAANHVIGYDLLTATATQGYAMTSAANETCAGAIASLQGAADAAVGQPRSLLLGVGN
jgi:hypothetical protein